MKKILFVFALNIAALASLMAQATPTPFPESVSAPATAPATTAPSGIQPVTTPGVTLPDAAPNPPPTPMDDDGPAPYPTAKKEVKPSAPKVARTIPARFGDTTGEVFIGQRTIVDRYAGWGWIKKEKDGWNRSKWAMLEEKPGVIFAPGRYLGSPDNDKGTQYKLYGQWAPYKGYEPNYDVFVDVFQIKGFEMIGPGEIPKMNPPRSNRGKSNSEGPYQRRAGGTTR